MTEITSPKAWTQFKELGQLIKKLNFHIETTGTPGTKDHETQAIAMKLYLQHQRLLKYFSAEAIVFPRLANEIVDKL